MCEYPSYSLALADFLSTVPGRRMSVRVAGIGWDHKACGRSGVDIVQVHRLYRVTVRALSDRYGIGADRWLIEESVERIEDALRWTELPGFIGNVVLSTSPEEFAKRCLATLGVDVTLSPESVRRYIPWCEPVQVRRIRLVSVKLWGELRFATCVASTFPGVRSYVDQFTGQSVEDEGVADVYISPIGVVATGLLFTDDMGPGRFVRCLSRNGVADKRTIARALQGYEPEASLVALRLSGMSGAIMLISP